MPRPLTWTAFIRFPSGDFVVVLGDSSVTLAGWNSIPSEEKL